MSMLPTAAQPRETKRLPVQVYAAGAWALLNKETMRFVKVAVQTILAPVVSSLLFLLIFAHLLEGRIEPHPGMSYTAFLVPGLVMMIDSKRPSEASLATPVAVMRAMGAAIVTAGAAV